MSTAKVLYGLHFEPGVAEYKDAGKDPYRVLISEPTAKQMDSTFPGCPVFVDHVENVEDRSPDGYVVESFFNELDGKHWVKLVIITEKGEQAVRNGWKLSNAYIPKEFAQGGLWHGVEYAKEITKGEYEHLALVQKPRYESSVIMTPDQFKEYNSAKEAELQRLSNSQGEETVFDIFKKAKVENQQDLESLMVSLPLCKKDVKLSTIINEMDKIYNMHGYANGDHMVKVGEDEMSVNDLVGKHMDMAECMKKMNDEKAALEKEQKEVKEKEKDDEGKKKNEQEDDKKVNDAHFDKLKNAVELVRNQEPRINLGVDGAARGKVRYGSGN